jgi:hypothetical protein
VDHLGLAWSPLPLGLEDDESDGFMPGAFVPEEFIPDELGRLFVVPPLRVLFGVLFTPSVPLIRSASDGSLLCLVECFPLVRE